MSKKLHILLSVVLVFCACQGGRDKDDVVARAYDNFLYASDIEGLVAEGTTPEDSAAIVTNYVNQWLQQQVVLEKARRNVKNTFDKELQNYKNSLIIYEYERLIVEQMLDTGVSEREVEDYYNANIENFLLRASIVKAIYVKLPKSSPVENKLAALMSKSRLGDDDLVEIQKLTAAYGADYNFDMNVWTPFYRFQSVVPVESDAGLSGRVGQSLTVSDDQYVYIVRMFAFKSVGEVSPMEYERENIKSIILNRRKIDIIKNMQRDLLRDADAKGKIEIKGKEN